MTYRNDGKADRRCEICNKPIEVGSCMIDLFREEGSRVEWVHEACARKVIETWLKRKRSQ